MKAQEQLVRFVTGCNSDAALGELFEPASRARLEVYRQSFRGRVVTVLQETLLAPLTQLFGPSLVRETLACYFAAEPPTAVDLSEALRGLPEFLRRSFAGEIKTLFILIVEASLARWQLLTGPDPDPGVSGGRLKPCCIIAGSSGVLLHEAWLAATADKPAADIAVFHNQSAAAAALLLIKTSPTDLLTVEVAPSLGPLVQILAEGASLAQAIQTLTPAAADAITDTELAAFIGAMVTHAALYV